MQDRRSRAELIAELETSRQQLSILEGQQSELEHRLEALGRSERLRSFMVSMNRCRSLEEMFVELLRAALEVCSMDAGAVYLLEEDSAILRIHRGLPEGLADELNRVPRSSKEITTILAGSEPAKAVALSGDWSALFVRHGLHHGSAVAVKAGKEAVGLLCVASRRAEPPEPGLLKVLGTLASEAEAPLNGLRAQAALRDSEERFRSLTEATSDWIWEVDPAGVYTYAGPKIKDLLGYEPEEVLGKRPFDLMTTDDAKRVEGVFKEIVSSRRAFAGLENVNRHKSGRAVVIETSGVPIIAASGDLIGYRGIDRDVTERKKAEEALQESEERFRRTFEQAAVGIAHVAPGGRFLRINQRFCDIVGYSREALLTRSFQEMTHPDDLDADLGNMERVLAGDISAFSMEKRYIRKDGSFVWVNLTVSLVRSSSGRPRYFISVVEDITDRKAAEEALRQSEEKFRHIIESSPMGVHIYELAPDGRLMFTGANPAADRLLGVDNSQFIGKCIEEAFPPSKETEIPGRYRLAAEKGEPWWAEQINYEHGQIKGAFEVYAFQTSPGKMVAMFLEITPRKQAEEALKESEEKYRHLVENINEVIFATDEHGEVTYISPTVESMSGYRPDEIVGRPFSQFIHQDDLPATRERFNKSLAGALAPDEYRVLTKSGEVLWVGSSSRPLLRDNRVIGLQGVLVDLTRAKKSEEEKRRLEIQLRQAQRMEAIGHLAGGVAHDFNNLLSPILGYAELVSMDLHPDDPRYGNLTEIQTAAHRARDLTRQLLAFSRRQVMELKTLNLGDLVSGFEKMLRRTIREDIEIKVDVPASLGSIQGDVSQIEQILMNLAVNAQDAMPRGGKLTISTENVDLDETYVRTHPNARLGPHVMLAVSDTGEGIGKENLGHLFEPFFTTKEDGKGTGLGLATVYGIVKQHDGNIWVYSEPGKGTTFKVFLPRVDEAAQVLRERTIALTGDVGTETVMVVEDNKMVRDLTCTVLKEYGYRIIEVESAEECLGAVEHLGEVDLLLTDVVMPEMNGRDLYQKLSSSYRDLKVLFMSGYASDLVAHHGVLVEAGNFIQKPFSIEDLTRKVREVLDS